MRARHFWLVLLLCVLLASLTISTFLPAKVYADPSCVNSGVYVLWARGSGEHINSVTANAIYWSLIGDTTHPGSLTRAGVKSAWAELGNVDGDVPTDGFHDPNDPTHEYPAAGGAGSLSAVLGWLTDPGYGNSVRIGTDELVKHLNDRVQRCPSETFVLGGYSQGADVIGWALQRTGGDSNWSLSSAARNQIGFVALYGDPQFNRGSNGTNCDANDNPPSWLRISLRCDWAAALAGDDQSMIANGVVGSRDPYILSSMVGRVASWCDPYDFVCTDDLNNAPFGIETHLSAYRNKWIAASMPEIAGRAIAKRDALNPLSYIPIPSYSVLPLATPINPSPPAISTPPATNLRPTAVQFGQEVDVYQAGGDNTIYKDTWNGSNWGGFSSMGGSTADNPSSVSFNGEMDVFIRGGDGQIYKKTWINNAWSGWNSLGGNMVGSPSSVALGSEMDVFARGQDGGIYKDTWNGSFWSGWNPLGGNMAGNPVAAQYGNELDVFAQGSNGALWKDTWNGSGWSGWNSLGGVITGDISAVTYGSHLGVFVRGTDNQIWESTWNGTAWTWNCLGGNVPGSPVALSYNGELDVFVRGGDGRIYKQTTWDDLHWSGWTSLDGNMIGDLAAVQYNGEMDVFARASGDRKIYKKTWNGSSWSGWNYLG